jgi:hypothetical protein
MSPLHQKPFRKISYSGDRDQIDFLVEVARAYYEQNHDQASIAKSLGISRSQVSRYLSLGIYIFPKEPHSIFEVATRANWPDVRAYKTEISPQKPIP